MQTKIFVGRLPLDAKPEDLRTLFEKFGVVTECDVLNRFGFVHMKSEDMAKRAIQSLHNTEYMGSRITVEVMVAPSTLGCHAQLQSFHQRPASPCQLL